MSSKPSKLSTLHVRFKRDTLALLMRDNIFCQTVLLEIPEDMFAVAPNLGLIFSVLKDFFERHGTRPRLHELQALVKDVCARAKMDESTEKRIQEEHSTWFSRDEHGNSETISRPI